MTIRSGQAETRTTHERPPALRSPLRAATLFALVLWAGGCGDGEVVVDEGGGAVLVTGEVTEELTRRPVPEATVVIRVGRPGVGAVRGSSATDERGRYRAVAFGWTADFWGRVQVQIWPDSSTGLDSAVVYGPWVEVRAEPADSVVVDVSLLRRSVLPENQRGLPDSPSPFQPPGGHCSDGLRLASLPSHPDDGWYRPLGYGAGRRVRLPLARPRVAGDTLRINVALSAVGDE